MSRDSADLHRVERPRIIGDQYIRYDKRLETGAGLEGIAALAHLGLFIVFFAIIFYLVHTLPHLFTILNRNVPNRIVLALLGSIGSLLVGILLYYLKARKRLVYASLEIAFALVAAAAAILKIDTQGGLSVCVGLSAASYLIVRGMGNIQKAKDQRKKAKAQRKKSHRIKYLYFAPSRSRMSDML